MAAVANLSPADKAALAEKARVALFTGLAARAGAAPDAAPGAGRGGKRQVRKRRGSSAGAAAELEHVLGLPQGRPHYSHGRHAHDVHAITSHADLVGPKAAKTLGSDPSRQRTRPQQPRRHNHQSYHG